MAEQKVVHIFGDRFLPPDRHPVVVVESLKLGDKPAAQYFAFLRRDGSPPVVQILSFDAALVTLKSMISATSDFVVDHARQRAESELNLQAFKEFTANLAEQRVGAVFEPVRLEEKGLEELAHFLLSVDRRHPADALEEHCRSSELKRYLQVLSVIKATVREVEPAWKSEARRELEMGRKIDAIKIVRGNTNLGLKEAKDLVDAWEKSENPQIREAL